MTCPPRARRTTVMNSAAAEPGGGEGEHRAIVPQIANHLLPDGLAWNGVSLLIPGVPL